MDFRITLTRPPLVADFEVGSIAEAVGVLEQENSALMNMFRIADSLAGGPVAAQDSTAVASGTVAAPEGTETKPKGRGKKGQEAVAPAPLPVPTAAAGPATTTLPPNALAPPDMTPGPNGIPAALDRTREVAAPPPPLLPAAPSIAPPPPPAPPVAGVLGAKVVAALEARKPFPDEGKALVAWLAAYQLVVPGCTYDEACEVVLHLSDEKLAAAAGALSVAA